mgnify:FL=1
MKNKVLNDLKSFDNITLENIYGGKINPVCAVAVTGSIYTATAFASGGAGVPLVIGAGAAAAAGFCG